MRTVDVFGVRVEPYSAQPLLLLREQKTRRYLPIWIGVAEASAIAAAQENVVTSRPQTHDLMCHLIEDFGHTLCDVRIIDVLNGIYHAQLCFENNMVIESRASDAVALAIRAGCPILCVDAVLEESGIELPVEVDGDQERQIKEFREALEKITPADFVDPNPDKMADP